MSHSPLAGVATNVDLAFEPKTVSVVGLGYIGLPTAAMFASTGLRVFGLEVSQRVVDIVNAGGIHIEEGDLDTLVADCVRNGRLSAHLEAQPADAFVIAVPTPVDPGNGHVPDVSYVQAAGRAVAPVLQAGNLVILESTSPVGTTEMLSELLAELRPDLTFPHQEGDAADVHLAYCPERIIPGRMLRELVENDRIIGGMTPESARRAAALYGRFVEGACHLSNSRTAEMVKLTENAFRDVNIAFANELSMICDELGIDAWDVIDYANRHPRVSILNPGPGVGGHCIAVDPWFIVAKSPERARLILTAREVNDAKPEFVIAKVRQALEANPEARASCFGLSYKPDVDDFRESPSLDIATALGKEFPGRVSCCDPFSEMLPPHVARERGIEFVTPDEGIQAEVIVMLVGHAAFRGLVPQAGKVVVDTVGFWR